MNIKMTRGDLLQLSQSVQKVVPAKTLHAEKYRRAAAAILKLAKKVNATHKDEIDATYKALPKEEQTEKALLKVREDFAKLPVVLVLDKEDFQALVAGFMNHWHLPVNELGNGMPYEALKTLHEDLVALGAWATWDLGKKLVLPDPELDKILPLGDIDDGKTDEELPLEALED